MVIFDLTTAHWTCPELGGPKPRGRSRHAAIIHDDKLFITGGMSSPDDTILNDVCYLDLKTMTWSRSWQFVPRYDHSTFIHNGKLWVSGGMTEEMKRTGELWWLNIEGPAFHGVVAVETSTDDELEDEEEVDIPRPTTFLNYDSRSSLRPMHLNTHSSLTIPVESRRPNWNESNHESRESHMWTSIQRRTLPPAPGTISFLNFVTGPNVPAQNAGYHFHVFSSGCLLDFATVIPSSPIHSLDTSLSSLDLDTFSWQRLMDGKDLFKPNYGWQYCCLDEAGINAWLLGCPMPVNQTRQDNDLEETLSSVLRIDLRKIGLLGNKLANEFSKQGTSHLPRSDSGSIKSTPASLLGIGADLSRVFDTLPDSGSGTDFIITAEVDDLLPRNTSMDHDTDTLEDSPAPDPQVKSRTISKPIHVHRFLMSIRWPHFDRLFNSQMAEYQQMKLHIPEPYSSVRAFLYYLYTDSISSCPTSSTSSTSSTEAGIVDSLPSVRDVAGMLVMSNLYAMPRLQHICINHLVKSLDIEHAALIFEHASIAQEGWLKKRAAAFCLTNWGRIVRTDAFKRLKRDTLLELCEEVDFEGRIVGAVEDVESGFPVANSATFSSNRSSSAIQNNTVRGHGSHSLSRGRNRFGTAASEFGGRNDGIVDGVDDDGMEVS